MNKSGINKRDMRECGIDAAGLNDLRSFYREHGFTGPTYIPRTRDWAIGKVGSGARYFSCHAHLLHFLHKKQECLQNYIEFEKQVREKDQRPDGEG